MKKYFIMALVAITSVAFTACKKGNGPDKGKVVVNPKSIELSKGTQQKIRASVDPAATGTISFSYTSSDPSIASVNANGIVTGEAIGKASIVVSAEGYKADTCSVTVVDPYDVFAWGSMGLFKIDQTKPIGSPFVYQGENMQNYEGKWYVWDNNIVYTDGVGFSGAGFIAVITCPVALITDGEYAGYYATWELNFNNSMPADSSGVCAEGSLTDAEEWGKYITDSTYKGDGSFKGTPIHYYDWDDDSGENDYYFVGYIKNGWIGDYQNGFFYEMNINWFDLDQGLYGLKMEQDPATGMWGFVQPFTFTDVFSKYYTLLPQQSAAPKVLRKQIVVNEKQAKKLEKLNTTSFHMAK